MLVKRATVTILEDIVNQYIFSNFFQVKIYQMYYFFAKTTLYVNLYVNVIGILCMMFQICHTY